MLSVVPLQPPVGTPWVAAASASGQPVHTRAGPRSPLLTRARKCNPPYTLSRTVIRLTVHKFNLSPGQVSTGATLCTCNPPYNLSWGGYLRSPRVNPRKPWYNGDMERDENLDRLEEIQNELADLTREAGKLVRRLDPEGHAGHVWARAKGYWYAQLLTAVSDEHDFLGGTMCTLADTIKELKEDGETEEG